MDSWTVVKKRGGPGALLAFPPLVLGLVTNLFVIRSLLRFPVSPETQPIWLTAWVGIAVALGLVGMGLVGWITLPEPSLKPLFLWGTNLAGLAVLAGASAPFVPQAYLFGPPALVFLAAVLLHFHLLVPLEVETHRCFPLLVVFYTLAGMLTTAWLLRPDGLHSSPPCSFML